MTQLSEAEPHAGLDASADLAPDRRRPGRATVVNEQLIPVLRGQLDQYAPEDPVVGRHSRLELVIGVVAFTALVLTGVALRFVA